MKILLIHNRYKHAGGEDSVFESEKNLLESRGHIVRTHYFDNRNIDHLSEKLKLSYQLIFNQKSKRIVRELIENFNPDIVHVHNFFYIASPSVFFAAAASKIPVVVTLHNFRLICSGSLLMRDASPCELCIHKMFPVEGVKYRCHRGSRIATIQLTLATGIHKFLNTWNKKVSFYIALTDFAKKKFINSSLNLSPERIVVKPNSVDDARPAGFNDRENYYLFIGRLSKEKGIEVILKAFENRAAIIEIIGDGPLKELVLEKCKSNPNIKYSGYKPKQYIIDRLRASKALIVPSVCYESLPTAILEAFSTGTPVIISDIENLNEIITNNYNGIHFRTNDPEDLYKVVESFNKNEGHLHTLYENARRTYLEKYTPELNYRNLIGVYTAAINNSSNL